jgi:hypothetical protein
MCREIALSREPFEIGHIHIYTFSLLRMTDTMSSQNIDFSSWDTLYSIEYVKGKVAIIDFNFPQYTFRHFPNQNELWNNASSRHLAGTARCGSAPLMVSTYTEKRNEEQPWHTAMPRARFDPAISVFVRHKTLRAHTVLPIQLMIGLQQ